MTHAAQATSERAPGVLFCRAAAVEAQDGDPPRTRRYVVSTDDIDGHGTIVKQAWDTKRFEPRGVVLYGHDYEELPIGTATVSMDAGKLTAVVTFSPVELNPKAEEVWKNVEAGVIRGISPGFIPHTITFERHDDREVMVLDDNELIELSITPCPSNANALAQMRSMRPVPQPEPTPPPPSDGPAVNAQPPIPEVQTMAENKPEPAPAPINTISILRALDLPFGATEQDGIGAAVRCRRLEVGVQELTGVQNTSEALGALRAMKVDADRCKAAEAELAKIKAERDAQNFEVLLAQGRTDRKLSPAEETYQRELFARDMKEGRGEARVEELRGFLKVKSPTIPSRDIKQPEARSGAALTADGKSYKDMSFSQRAALKKSDPELFRAMKNDYEASAT